ncbi:unnamed protein product [Lepeophtheirus salmonis]|uniref:(salmon louse) hypothetical protein n=1 Tax=Lepeophtheirus salmonis TaxID=72036 RepID=A0A7R8CE76_LEPSM|nr:unnamed protein product [Lepeophtheirus salmonis]CAF2793248.1 unnamed protein product [Lepeophtheirus salmonis]
MTPKNYRNKIQRGSPSWNSPASRSGSKTRTPKRGNSTSPNNFASSKCFEPPTPEALPRPPLDWMNLKACSSSCSSTARTLVFTPEEFFCQHAATLTTAAA